MNLMSADDVGSWLAERAAKADHLWVVTPFVTRAGFKPVLEALQSRPQLKVELLTSVDVLSTLVGALDLTLLRELLQTHARQVTVKDVPRLHAKVYIADEADAVFGSANLTRLGTGGGNIEIAARVRGKDGVGGLLDRVKTWAEQEPSADVPPRDGRVCLQATEGPVRRHACCGRPRRLARDAWCRNR